MDKVISKVKQFDQSFILFFRPRSLDILRVSIGIIYILFSLLKFFPEYSPAEQLAGDTIGTMTFGWIDGSTALVLLAIF